MEIGVLLFVVCVIGVLSGNALWFLVIVPVTRKIQTALNPAMEAEAAAVLDRSDRQTPPEVWIADEAEPGTVRKINLGGK